MFERKNFNFNTRVVATNLMVALLNESICGNMQEVGKFIDGASAEISQVTARYFLARVSNETKYTLGQVNADIRNLAYGILPKYSPHLPPAVLDRVMVIIYREMAAVYSQQFPSYLGQYDDYSMTQTSFYDYSIFASKVIRENGANSSYYSVHQIGGQGAYRFTG